MTEAEYLELNLGLDSDDEQEIYYNDVCGVSFSVITEDADTYALNISGKISKAFSSILYNNYAFEYTGSMYYKTYDSTAILNFEMKKICNKLIDLETTTNVVRIEVCGSTARVYFRTPAVTKHKKRLHDFGYTWNSAFNCWQGSSANIDKIKQYFKKQGVDLI